MAKDNKKNTEQQEIKNDDVDKIAEEKPEEKSYDLNEIDDIVALIKTDKEDEIRNELAKFLNQRILEFECENYHTVFLFDKYDSINKLHSDKIYKSISNLKNEKDILLIILSNGGQIEPAYLISKTCKRLSRTKFVISIPRQAKSAATLISLGADELHMGLLSELGPIDPQFGGFPALGFTNALRRIASLSSEFPGSGDMFAKYLIAHLDLKDLGYLERINESAAQYAERLLTGKSLPNDKTPADLADHFTNHYKDHSFVVDLDESTKLLGSNVVKEKTKEYYLGDIIYDFLNIVDIIAKIFLKKNIRYIGGIETGFCFVKKDDQ